MFFKLGLILLWASAINCALVNQRQTSHDLHAEEKNLTKPNALVNQRHTSHDDHAEEKNLTKPNGACDVCKCSGGGYVYCDPIGLTSVPKDFPLDTVIIYFNNNDISSVKPQDFDYLKKLELLGLRGNKLTTLPPDLFENMSQLTRIELDCNKLTTIPSGLLDNLNNLGAIFFSENNLNSLPLDIFKNNKLWYLSLEQNPSFTCSCDLYRTLVNVIPKLTWHQDELGTCDGNVDLNTMTPGNWHKFCAVKPIITTPIPTTKALTTKSKDACHICLCRKDSTYGGMYVDCRNRRLTRIPDNVPETATTLNLFHNNVKSISFNDFKKLKALRYINLSRNKLTTLPRRAFHNLNNLERLSIADNELARIESRCFDSFDQLKEVELYGNKLTSLPGHLFENILGLELLDLSDNDDLSCTCLLYHVLVKVVKNLGDRVLGTCGDGVDLSTITEDNKDKFCGKR